MKQSIAALCKFICHYTNQNPSLDLLFFNTRKPASTIVVKNLLPLKSMWETRLGGAHSAQTKKSFHTLYTNDHWNTLGKTKFDKEIEKKIFFANVIFYLHH